MSSIERKKIVLKPYRPIVPLAESQLKPTNNTSKNTIDVFPTQVIFTDVLLNQTYEINLTIRNMASDTRKIRLFIPFSKHFTVRYDPKISSLASGLAMKATIIFDAKEASENEYSTQLRLVSEDFDKIIPIRAYASEPSIRVTELINFGMVALGKCAQRQLQITNLDKRKVQCELRSECEDVSISQNNLTLKQCETIRLQVKYSPSATTILRSKIMVIAKSARNITKQCQIRATTNKTFYYMADGEGNKIESIRPELLYIGQNPSFKFFIINNTQETLTWKSSVVRQSRKDKKQIKTQVVEPRSLAEEQQQRIVHMVPEQAAVKPFSEMPVELHVNRRPTIEQLQSMEKFLINGVNYQPKEVVVKSHLNIHYEFNKTDQKQSIMLPVDLTFIMPKVQLSQNIFEFDQVHLKQTKNMGFEIINHEQKQIQLEFLISKASPFTIKGPKSIQARSTQVYMVLFHPTVLGKMKENIKLSILKCFSAEIKMFGESIEQSMLSKTMSPSKTMFRLSTSYNYQRRNKRNQQKIRSFVRSRLEKNLTFNVFDGPKDPIFEAGIFESPRTNLVRLPIYSEELYLDDDFIEKKLCHFPQDHKEVWPDKPKNHRQARDIAEQLTTVDLKNIIVNSSQIDFGTVFVKHESRRVFAIKNNTNRYILVEIIIDDEELKKTDVKKQIIPPKETGSFQMVLECRLSGEYKATVKYVINDSHNFQFVVTSTLIPIALEPSSKMIKLSFMDSNMSFYTTETFRLFNHGNARTQFKFNQNSDSAFTIEPAEGQVEQQTSMELRVFYTPKCLGSQNSVVRVDEEKKYFRVIGGNETFFKCQGTVAEAKCTIKQTEINLGEIPVSSTAECHLTIKNTTRLPTVFKIDFEPESLNSLLKVDQPAYRLAAEERKEVPITCFSKTQRLIKGDIICTVRASRKFRIPFSVRYLMPKVDILQKQINFGKVTTIGHSFVQYATIRNDSLIKAVIQAKIDANKMAGELEILGAEGHEDCITISTEVTPDESISESYGTEQSHVARITKKREVDDINSYYFITVPSNSQVRLVFRLTPKVVGCFSHIIPFTIKGQDPSQSNIKTKVTYEAIFPTLLFEPQLLNFKKKIISQKDHKILKAQINNPCDRPIRWRILQSSLEGGTDGQNPFKIQPSSGQIPAFTKIYICAFFSPCSANTFEASYRIFVDESTNSDSQFKMAGLGILPSIVFDRRQVIFPTVPVGIESKVQFKIENDGYDSVSLNKWRCEDLPAYVEFKLDFKEGRTLSVMKKKISVQATFKSTLPISLTAMLNFTDDCYKRFVLPVSFTCDNSLLTLYSYFEIWNDSKLHYDDKDVIQLGDETKNDIKSQKRLTPKSSTPAEPQTVFRSYDPKSIKRSAGYICRWLQHFVDDKFSAFPKTLCETNGDCLVQMLFLACGRPVEPLQLSSDRTQKVNQLIQFYDKLIRELKSEGCMLNHIRPQYLLSEGDLAFYSNYIDNSHVSYAVENFENLSIESWAILFFQLVRVFLLPKLSAKSIKPTYSLLGLEQPVQKQTTSNSNVYSAAQMLMLGLVNSILNEKDKRITTFDDSRLKGEFFALLLNKVLGLNIQDNMRTITKESKIEDVIANCNIIIHTLTEYGLVFHLTAHDLVYGSAAEIFLYLYHLFSNLPQYFPKQTIKFICELREETQKTIELNNPSSKEVSYKAKLIGDDGFQLQSTDITLQPKQNQQFKITYSCRFFKSSEAKLFFIQKPQDDIKNRVCPIAFNLKTEVLGKTLSKVITYEAHLYELMTLNIEVESPFTSCEYPFDVTVSLMDEPKKKQTSPSFFLLYNKIKLFKLKDSKLELKFIAMNYEDKSCKISFYEPVRGQFIYELRVKVLKPLALRTIRLKDIYINTVQDFNLDLPCNNQYLLRARKSFVELTKTAKGKPISYGPKYNIEVKPADDVITIPKEIMMFKNKSEEDIHNEEFTIPLKLEFKRAYKDYSFYISLSNPALTDIRVFKIQLRVLPQPIRIKILMETYAREELTQYFPIRSYPTKVSLQTDSEYLHISTDSAKDYTLPTANNSKVGITFKPTWMCKASGTLTMLDQETMDQLIYQISCLAREPKPEAVITLKIQNHQKLTKTIEHKTNTMNLAPELRMSYCTLTTRPLVKDKVPASKSITYDLEFQSKDVGMFVGQLRLIDSITMQYFIYSIILQVVECQKRAELEVTARVGTTKTIEIKDVGRISTDYIVSHNLPFVRCLKTFIRNADESFTLTFSPMKQLTNFEGRLVFTHKNEEQAYIIKLNATELPIIKLNEMAAYVNKTSQTSILLNNPLDEQVAYKISCNSDFFTVPDFIGIPPHGSNRMHIIFCPKQHRQNTQCLISLTASNIFSRRYEITGICIQPQKRERIVMCSDLIQPAEHVITYRNPFSETANIQLSMEPQSSSFSLSYDGRQILEPKQEIQIRVDYRPTERKCQNVMLTIDANGKYRCNYDLVGEVVTELKETQLIIETECRQPKTQLFTLRDQTITECISRIDIQKPWSKILNAKIISTVTGCIVIQMAYMPMKPINKTKIPLTLVGQSNCKWIVSAVVSALVPAIDDTIVLEAGIMEASEVSFKMTNTSQTNCQFKAYLGDSSDTAFDIEPKRGVLEAYGSAGTNFRIIFKPTQVSIKYRGLAIIETEEMYWSFQVIGKLPKYKSTLRQ